MYNVDVIEIESKKVTVAVTEDGGVAFKVLGSDGKYKVFSIRKGSYGLTEYRTPRYFGDDINTLKIKSLAPRTARRHFKALVDDVPLDMLT